VTPSLVIWLETPPTTHTQGPLTPAVIGISQSASPLGWCDLYHS
jgi:hypothetical protein